MSIRDNSSRSQEFIMAGNGGNTLQVWQQEQLGVHIPNHKQETEGKLGVLLRLRSSQSLLSVTDTAHPNLFK